MDQEIGINFKDDESFRVFLNHGLLAMAQNGELHHVTIGHEECGKTFVMLNYLLSNDAAAS